MKAAVKGRMIPVDNTNRAFGSALSYVAIQVENQDGREEQCLLFTQAEIDNAKKRAARNPEDLTKKGFFRGLFD
jgi:hypothetical protein